jgi:outer membrane protein insertion porin family
MSQRTIERPAAGRTTARIAWIACLAALLALAGSLGLAPRAAAAPDETTLLDAVRFEGLARVDSVLVRETVLIKPGDTLHPARVSASVQALYGLGLFDDVQADILPAAAGHASVLFRVKERPSLHEIAFNGQKFFNVDDLKGHAALNPGEILTPAKLDKAQRAIEDAYRAEGFAKATARAEVVPDSGGTLVRFQIEEHGRVKVREIAFTGNRAFETKKLRGEIGTRASGFLRKGRFTREKLTEDVTLLETFYHNHGYKDARVTAQEPSFSPDGEGVAIGFAIEEGPQYRFQAPAWSGATIFPVSELLAATEFRQGEPFDQSRIDATSAAVANLYTERGYLTQLRIDPALEVTGDSVLVTFQVVEGEPSHVGDIRVVGNTATKERVVRRELTLYPGSLLRRSVLLRSQRDVFATGHFEDVQIEFEPSPKPEEVDVVFRVKEKSSVVATAGAGYSSEAGLTGFVEFGHSNLFGNGQSISMKLEHGGKRDYYDLSFTEPWVSGRPISAGVDLYRTELFREIYTAGTSDDGYWQRRGGGGVRLGFPWFFKFPDYTRFSTGYSYTDTRYTEIEDLSSETQKLLLDGAGGVSRVFFSLYRNSTDNPFHPTLGARTTLRTEFNGRPLGGDMNYYTVTVDHRQYFVPVWKPVVMLRWRFGMIDTYGRPGDKLPASERFRLGGTAGVDYLRGYQDYYVVPSENIYRSSSTGNEVRFPGGKVMFGWTGELQFPIVSPVYGVLFLDAGDTWNSMYDANLSSIKFGTGAGVTLEIPMLGPLGFYYGYGSETRKWTTHFTFGTQL